ncbi:hypothetical protein GLOIN_2v1488990 [Rhizophagus irregularis DAOM 181602=DAOM 197198]|uniref:Uncharacterized protein n=1 Tax=Rhizophagus irregularis (strain DAOM 181602 / DAOM 197198 / MUCL 43194) TaxID=747089 RepID=A0A2P4NXQ7_RHIID|nr:hypothetical protein GLOIN_2v1488990 [Rhizophagus irregularis DAOM 181602=DAOM 197198]POG57931.1 hypothetical protein GLOIN_2v1488990 [Rhizophagus irregularis DAOM 181602=DAOM 197198]|eukprot:XP_025164797.1 hypothetical protein GLOIN_2v1488990 [Rhizophagus irregularis DAOM 181602=DAOM 197198]
MAKKNVHRNTTSGTDSSSSDDDEFAEQKDEIVTKLLPALRKLVDKRYKVTNKELLDMLYGRWHSRHREYNIRIQGEEKIKNNKRRTAKNSKMQDKKKRRVVEANYLIKNNDNYINRNKIPLRRMGRDRPQGRMASHNTGDKIDINNQELWLEKELIVKEAVKTKTTSIYIYDKWWRSPELRLLLHKRIDPTVNLLRTKQTTLKYKRIDGNIQETGVSPNGAPSWCLNKAALERLNRSTEVPIYD